MHASGSNASDTPLVRLAWIAALRIVMGVLFVTTWIENLKKGFYTPEGMANFFTHIYPQAHNPLTFYAAFITNAVIPHTALVAPFQLVFELALGVLLIAGLATPLVALAAAAFLFNIFLATFGAEWPWVYLSLIAICLVCAFTRSGRAFGLDAAIARKYPAAKFV